MCFCRFLCFSWKVEEYDNNNYIAYDDTYDVLMLLISNDRALEGDEKRFSFRVLSKLLHFEPDVVVVGCVGHSHSFRLQVVPVFTVYPAFSDPTTIARDQGRSAENTIVLATASTCSDQHLMVRSLVVCCIEA